MKEQEDYSTTEGKPFIINKDLINMIGNGMSLPEIRIYSTLLLQYKVGIGFEIGKVTKKELANKHGFTYKSVHNTIYSLINKEMLIKEESGYYQINARYAFQGSTKERKKVILFQIENQSK